MVICNSSGRDSDRWYGKNAFEKHRPKRGGLLVTNGSQRMKYIEALDSKIQHRKKGIPDSFRVFRLFNGVLLPSYNRVSS